MPLRTSRRLGLVLLSALGLSACQMGQFGTSGSAIVASPAASSPLVGTSDGRDVEALVPRRLDVSEPLPHRQVTGFSMSRASIPDMLRLLLNGSGISLTVDADNLPSRVTAQDVSGDLGQVVEDFAETAGFFYTYRNKVMTVQQSRRFVVLMPPGQEIAEAIGHSVGIMGGKEVAVDPVNRLLSFTADRKTWRQVTDYLDLLRRTKVALSWDARVWQVEAARPALDLRLIQDGAGAIAASDITRLTEHLAGQGRTELLGAPTMAMISGGESSFSVAQAGQRFGSADDTTQISSALSVQVKAAWHEGAVFADVTAKASGADSGFNRTGGEVSQTFTGSWRLTAGQCAVVHGPRRAMDQRTNAFVVAALCPRVTSLSALASAPAASLPAPDDKMQPAPVLAPAAVMAPAAVQAPEALSTTPPAADLVVPAARRDHKRSRKAAVPPTAAPAMTPAAGVPTELPAPPAMPAAPETSPATREAPPVSVPPAEPAVNPSNPFRPAENGGLGEATPSGAASSEQQKAEADDEPARPAAAPRPIVRIAQLSSAPEAK